MSDFWIIGPRVSAGHSESRAPLHRQMVQTVPLGLRQVQGDERAESRPRPFLAVLPPSAPPSLRPAPTTSGCSQTLQLHIGEITAPLGSSGNEGLGSQATGTRTLRMGRGVGILSSTAEAFAGNSSFPHPPRYPPQPLSFLSLLPAPPLPSPRPSLSGSFAHTSLLPTGPSSPSWPRKLLRTPQESALSLPHFPAGLGGPSLFLPLPPVLSPPSRLWLISCSSHLFDFFLHTLFNLCSLAVFYECSLSHLKSHLE